MTIPRLLHRLYARLGGFFWLPCPLCGEPFGGHEWRHVGGHLSDIPSGETPGSGQGICPACTAQGAGCRAWAEAVPVKQYATCSCDLWPEHR